MRNTLDRLETEECLFESNLNSCKYRYSIITSEIDIDSLGKQVTYGIRIDRLSVNNNVIEEKSIEDICTNKKRMTRIISILNKLGVTPINLEDVIIDNI